MLKRVLEYKKLDTLAMWQKLLLSFCFLN